MLFSIHLAKLVEFLMIVFCAFKIEKLKFHIVKRAILHQ